MPPRVVNHHAELVYTAARTPAAAGHVHDTSWYHIILAV